MNLARLLNDVVKLVKSNGKQYENIKASIQSDIILIADIELPIEEGDYILRELPNGLVETYLVLDRGFTQVGRGPIGSYYQVQVQKESAIQDKARALSVENYNYIVGDQINLSNIQESTIVTKSDINKLVQNVNTSVNDSDLNKDKLQDLIAEFTKTLESLSSEHQNDVSKILRRLEILLQESSAEKIDKERIEITGESLIAAAKNLAAVAPTVLAIATQIVKVIMSR